MPIQFSAVTSVDVSTGDTTVSHTVGTGSNRLLVVCIATAGAATNDHTLASLTYAGQSLTQATALIEPTFTYGVSIWYLLDPPSGTADVDVQFVGAPWTTKVSALSYTGVDALFDAFSDFSVTSNVDTYSIDCAAPRNGLFVSAIGTLNPGAGPQNPDANQTERTDLTANFRGGGSADRIVVDAGTYTSTWTNPSIWPGISMGIATFSPVESDNAVFFGMNF